MGPRRPWGFLIATGLLLTVTAIAFGAPFGSRSLHTGRTGEDVSLLQQVLISLGYAPGAVDGIFGTRTLSALTKYQADAGLPQDGVADEWEFASLSRSVARQRAAVHAVEADETLESIARENGTTPAMLRWLNQVPGRLLLPGQLLYIPRGAESVTPPPTKVPGRLINLDGDWGGGGEPPTGGKPVPGPSLPESGWVFPNLTGPEPVTLSPEPVTAEGPLVVGYYAEDWSGDGRSLESLRRAGGSVDAVVNFQFRLDAKGDLTSWDSPALLAEAKSRGIKVYGLVHNYGVSNFDAEVARAVLSDPAIRSHAVDQMVAAVQEYGLAGIDLDLENVPGSLRYEYTTLLRELSQRLRGAGYGLSVSVPAKTYDDRTSSWGGAYDYAAIGPLVDRVAVMTYDEHTPGFTAGPIASLAWVERVAAYASQVIEPQKVLLGIAAYGYDWIAGTTTARGISSPSAQALAVQTGVAVEWDAEARVPFLRYWENGVQRIVYFENAESTALKLDLVAKYGLGGIAIWRLGLEDPAIWPVIQAKLG